MSVKHELQNIISVISPVRNGEIIQTITHYLRTKKEAISEPERSKYSKDQETEILKELISFKDLWYNEIN